MSQHVTEAIASSLEYGDILYHNILESTNPETGETTPYTAKVLGPVRNHRYEGFALPIKRLYGDNGDTFVSKVSIDLWRTVPEKVIDAPQRIRRTRHAAMEDTIPSPAAEEQEAATPTGRIRRHREVAKELLDNALDQQVALRRSRVRSA